MKNLKIFESFGSGPAAPEFNKSLGKNGILFGDKFWIVFVFESAGKEKDRFKAISPEGETFQNLINLIKGGTHATEIAGIFKNEDDAKKFYDSLKYREEE